MKTAVVALAPCGAAPRGVPLWLARALQRPGQPCTLVWVSRDVPFLDAQPSFPDVETLYVNRLESTVARRPDHPLLHLAVQVAPILRRFDLVYSFAWGHPAMGAIRERRLSAAPGPFVVTVAGDTFDAAAPGPSSDPADWHQQSGERYQVKRSDALVCLGPVRPEDLKARGWVLPRCVRWLGLDRHAWWTLHQEMQAEARAAAAAPPPVLSPPCAPGLTICVRHRDQERLLRETLAALEQQTSDAFTVVVADDGSHRAADDGSHGAAPREGFERMEERLRERGWRFLRTDSVGPGAAWNLAGRDARSEYLAFVDAGDVPLPRFAARLLEAARCSGDDLLLPWARRRGADGSELECTPAGHDLLETLLPEAAGATCLVRRDAFQAVGGFPERAVAGGEVAALRARISLSGYAADVVPEILYLSREDVGSCGPSPDDVLVQDAIARAYGGGGPLHLPSFATAFQSLLERRRAARVSEARLRRALDRRIRRTGGLRLLLMLSYWPHPPASGAFQRWWAMIRYLGARHELSVLTFLAEGDPKDRAPLLEHCRSVYVVRHGEPRPRRDPTLPFLVRERQSRRMEAVLEEIAREPYDAAVLAQVFLAPYRERIRAPVLLEEENIESSLLEQVAQRPADPSLPPGFEAAHREAQLMRSYEDRVWPEFPVRAAVSEEERQEIQRRAGVGETILVENGADPEIRLRRVRPDSGRILFAGSLEWYPNVDGVLFFLHDIWPRLSRRRPSLRLVVAGRNPVPALRALRGRRVELVANPPDMRREAAGASVSVVPLRIGSGTRLKILESMALGLPVVSTSLGCRGLEVEDGKHLLVRDDPRAFSEAVEQVLEDRPLWEALRANGLSLIEHRYAWSHVLDPLDKKLWELAETWKR